MPRALEPLEVVRSVGDGPFAIKTVLGWTVNGPLGTECCGSPGCPSTVTANRISAVTLDKLCKQQFKMDFPESSQDNGSFIMGKSRVTPLKLVTKDKAHFQSASDSTQRKDVHHRVGFCDGFLSLEEIKDAEMQIIKFCQRKRRGQVQELRSDNDTNFVGGEHELRQVMEEWNQERIADALALKGVKWIFNPPTGSHHGGAWERLIRSIRKVLNSTLQTQYLDEEGLQTVLCEVESILNSRPITQESTDPNDLEALTPNHLLLLKSNPCLPPGLFQKNDLYAPAESQQLYQTGKDLYVRSGLRPQPAIYADRSQRYAFFRRPLTHDILELT
ncbi:hypothetical protein SRHO_G00032380 [Serrasalmus rhombeus]